MQADIRPRNGIVCADRQNIRKHCRVDWLRGINFFLENFGKFSITIYTANAKGYKIIKNNIGANKASS
jgi:hypothetical protein